MFDCHFHVNYFPKVEINSILEKAKAAGVFGGLVAGVWNEDTLQNLEWRVDPSLRSLRYFSRADVEAQWLDFPKKQDPFGVFLAHGLHPFYIHQHWLEENGVLLNDKINKEKLIFEDILSKNTDLIWAIGETGFDVSQEVIHHPHCKGLSKKEILSLQTECFRFCVFHAKEQNLPMILHSRGAWRHTMKELEFAFKEGVKAAMIHCYGGPVNDLPKLAEMGVFVSFGGVATWPKAKKVVEAARVCPANIFMLETDSPDLPPQHADGTRPLKNHPHELAYISQTIADLRGVSRSEIQALSDLNLKKFLLLN